MSDQMSRRGFMGAAATGAVALAGVALAGCSNTSASSEKSSEKEKAVKPVILVTSFGTSYNDSRHITIGAIEDLSLRSTGRTTTSAAPSPRRSSSTS